MMTSEKHPVLDSMIYIFSVVKLITQKLNQLSSEPEYFKLANGLYFAVIKCCL